MLTEGTAVDWKAPKSWDMDFGHTEGFYKTCYNITINFYKGEYRYAHKRFNYILEDGENLQEMFDKRALAIAELYNLGYNSNKKEKGK